MPSNERKQLEDGGVKEGMVGVLNFEGELSGTGSGADGSQLVASTQADRDTHTVTPQTQKRSLVPCMLGDRDLNREEDFHTSNGDQQTGLD